MKSNMKKRSFFTAIAALFSAFAFNAVMGSGIAYAVGASPVIGAAVLNIVGIALGSTGQVPTPGNLLTAGLVKEIWIAEVMQKWRPNPAWLGKARDLSAYVTNGFLNLAEAGEPTEK
jgi:hypothetical protein